MDPIILMKLRAALLGAVKAEAECSYYSNSGPFIQTAEAEKFLKLAMAHMGDLLDAAETAFASTQSHLLDALEQLIAAVEFEAPPIADGVDVEKRAAILMRCASEARETLRREIAQNATRVSDANWSLFDPLREAKKELEEIKNVLSDPVAVHTNMLHGGIAKLSINSCLHIHGVTNFDGWEDMTIREIEAKIAERDAVA